MLTIDRARRERSSSSSRSRSRSRSHRRKSHDRHSRSRDRKKSSEHTRRSKEKDDEYVFKGVASMRQDEAIASSCFRRRQIFAHLFHNKANVNFN